MDIQTLFDRYHDDIYRYLWRLCHDDQLAQDLTQDTFLKALRGLDSLPPDSHYRAWLYRIATNTHHDHWRKTKRQPQVDWDLEWLPSGENIEQGYEQRELLARVTEVVATLPPKQQRVLILSRYQDLDHAEIAQILNISPDSVRANLYLALKHIRQELAQ